MSDIVKITLWLPDQRALKDVLSSAHLNLECGSPKRDEHGNFIVTVYASPVEAEKIRQLKYRYEFDEKFGETLKKRQLEVSRTDRFQGGTIVPKGLGISK